MNDLYRRIKIALSLDERLAAIHDAGARQLAQFLYRFHRNLF
jgi:hypothetical protein